MSRRSGREIEKKANKRQASNNSFRGFVNHTLTKEDKKDYAQWALTVDVLGNELPTLLEDGYRITFSIDQRASAFMAAISTKDEESVNANLVLTARAGTEPLEAAARALFLHYHVLAEVWPPPGATEAYTDEWLQE